MSAVVGNSTYLTSHILRPFTVTYSQCTLINFIATEKGLEDQLLAKVVGVERPELEKQAQELQSAFNQVSRIKKLNNACSIPGIVFGDAKLSPDSDSVGSHGLGEEAECCLATRGSILLRWNGWTAARLGDFHLSPRSHNVKS